MIRSELVGLGGRGRLTSFVGSLRCASNASVIAKERNAALERNDVFKESLCLAELHV